MITFMLRVATGDREGRGREKLELDVYVILVGWKGRVIISNSVRSNERRIRLIIIESSKRGPLDRGHSAILDQTPPFPAVLFPSCENFNCVIK